MSAQGGTARRHGRSADLALLVALGVVLAACSSSGPEFGEHHHGAGYHRGQPSYKVGSAYQINGKWYRPRVDYGYDETGLGAEQATKLEQIVWEASSVARNKDAFSRE